MHDSSKVTLFSQIDILREVGHIHVAMFLESFGEELRAAGIEAPRAPDPAYSSVPEPEASQYFSAAAGIFERPELLPERLRRTVKMLEAAAADEAWLEATIKRRLPCISLNWNCKLECALTLWFMARDELGQFEQSANGETGVAAVENNG